jgi:ABC-type nitrate/sulfonate/bicarbonate transport system permease component
MKKLGSIGKRIAPWLFWLFLLLFWSLSTKLFNVPEYILPAPERIIITFFTNISSLSVYAAFTTGEAVVGLLISIALAFLTALAMDNFDTVKRAIYPFLVISQTIPVIVLAPLLILWFGYGLIPKIITVILVCFFPIAVNLYEGFNTADADLLSLFKSMGAKKTAIIRMIKIPWAMTSFFAGLRVASTYSIMGAVIGELLSGDGGLGYYMLMAKHSYAVDKVFSVIIVIVALSLALIKATDIIQKKFTPWQNNILSESRHRMGKGL